MFLYKNIRLLRRHFGLRQIDVAVDLDINQSYYSRIELGKANAQFIIIEKIADYFGISMDTLRNRNLESEPEFIPKKLKTKYNDEL